MRDVLILVILVFLFWGEPDVFDALRSLAISTLEKNKCH